jgi:hypothetical protein
VHAGVGLAVGAGVGVAVGVSVGNGVGWAVGWCDGDAVGACAGSVVDGKVGKPVGDVAGSGVGTCVGSAVGVFVGTAVGIGVGVAVGAAVGTAVGSVVGSAVGCEEGASVGIGVGVAVGVAVGCAVGAVVTHVRSAHWVAATPSKRGATHAVVAAQTRSLVAVHAEVIYCALPHASVVPLHTRSAAALPACNRYSLRRVDAHRLGQLVGIASVEHTVYGAHDGPEALAPYVTGAWLWYVVVAPHGVNAVHTRSSCAPLEPKFDSYWVAALQGPSAVHSRSEVWVGCVDTKWVLAPHAV